jgi:hypothetical protein
MLDLETTFPTLTVGTVTANLKARKVLPSEADGAEAIRALWKKVTYPCVACEKGQIRVRLPYAPGHKDWLRADEDGDTYGRRQPKWNPVEKYWKVPYSWRGEVIRKCIDRWGAVIVLQPTNKEMEKCASACWDAESDVTECECSCGGMNHGIKANPGGFFEISESLAVKWKGDEEVRATLITAADSETIASADAP